MAETLSAVEGPANIEVEQALLGAVLVSNDAYARVANFLQPRHFSEPLHARIFEIIGTIIEKGRVATPVTVKMFLPQDLRVGPMTGAQYLARLLAEATTIFNAADYGRVIQQLAARRSIAAVLRDSYHLVRGATSEEWEDPEAHIDEIEGRLEDLRSTELYRPGSSTEAVVERVIQRVADAYQRNEPVGLEWFLPGITRLAGRPQQGDLVGLLAASGDAKTTLALQWGRYLAKIGVPFHFLSGEQSQDQCVQQMISQGIGLDARNAVQGKISEKEFERLVDAGRGEIAKLPIRIETWSRMTVGQAAVRIRSFAKQMRIPDGDPFMVAIDHNRKFQHEHPAELFDIHEGLKDVAKSVGCVILILMQRNSDFVGRKIMVPVRRDAYGGEGTIQPLDLGLWVFRPARWMKERARIEDREDIVQSLLTRAAVLDAKAGSLGNDKIGLAQIGLLKARFGDEQQEPLDLRFVGPYTRFEPLPEPEVIDDGQGGMEL